MHSGGEAVQIGCPADLSGNPCRNDDAFAKTRIAANTLNHCKKTYL